MGLLLVTATGYLHAPSFAGRCPADPGDFVGGGAWMAGKRALLGLTLFAVLGGFVATHVVAEDAPTPPVRRATPRAADDFPVFETLTEGYETIPGFFTVYK